MSEVAQAAWWWLVVALLGWAAFPLCFVTFRALPDRGYGLSKIFGALLVTYLAWIGASLKLLPFTQATMVGLLGALALASAVAAFCVRWALGRWLAQRWRLALGIELLGLLFFATFALFRAFRPDFLDGEKRMDHVIMISLYTSKYFPAHDAWYAGGHVNYYYFGHMIAAALAKLSGCRWEFLYNLACATVPALVASAAFSVGLGVAGGLWGGLLTVGLYCLAANLDGLRMLIENHGHATPYFFWDSSRVMVDVWQTDHEPGKYVINEYPYFTFLFGDLHAHMNAMPLGFLSLGMALCLRLCAASERWLRSVLCTLWPMPLVLGAIAATNTWDLPAHAIVVGLALFFSWPAREQAGRRGLFARAAACFGLWALGMACARLLYHPFFSLFRPDIRWWEWQKLPQPATEPASYLLVWAPPFAACASYLALRVALDWRGRGEGKVVPWDIFLAIALAWVVLKWGFKRDILVLAMLVSLFALVLLALGVRQRPGPEEHFVLLCFAVGVFLLLWSELFYKVGYLGPPHLRMDTVFKMHLEAWMLFAPANAYALGWLWRRRGEFATSIGWLAPLALGVVFLCSLIGLRFRGDFPRLVPAAVAAGGLAALLFLCAGALALLRRRVSFNPAAALFFASCGLYLLTLPNVIWGTPNRLGRPVGGLTLDIFQGIRRRWPAQYQAIRWVLDNTREDEVILEAAELLDGSSDYTEIGHLSCSTGRPTLIAWQSHVFQWHVGDPEIDRRAREEYEKDPEGKSLNDLRRQKAWDEIRRRQDVVQRIYTTNDARLAAELARKEGIDYVFYGPIERRAYPMAFLEKFDSWEKVFEVPGAVIYRVPDGGREKR